MVNKFNFSIIIPNFNGAKFLESCIESLIVSLNKTKEVEYEIIFVDNASKDNSIEIFESLTNKLSIKNFKIQKLKTNTGFACAVNNGINASAYSWVILLNNDVIFHPDWFKHIINNIQKIDTKNLAAIFGTVLNSTGEKIESQGLAFFERGKAENINNSKPFLSSEICHLKSGYVWGASAALVIYQKSIIQKIGLFDEDFFAYEEDVDLAYRLNLLKYQTLYVPQAISYHLGGGTSSKMGNLRNRMDAKNWIYLIIKNYSLKKIFFNFFTIIEERFRNLSGLLKSTVKNYGLKSLYRLPFDVFRTYGEVLVKLPIMFEKRKFTQKLLKSTKYDHRH